MTGTIVSAVAPATGRKGPAFVDCDVHNELPDPQALLPYLPARWHTEFLVNASRGREWMGGGRSVSRLYPSRPQATTFRNDARPPSGGLPGSSFDFLKTDYLDYWNVEKAILAPLNGNGWPLHGQFAAALCAALNDWMVAEWLDRDLRLYGAITITIEDPILAAREITRASADARFVQVEMFSRTRDPLGHPRYWPIYEAAAAAGLPIAVHVGGAGNPTTGAGWPSYHFEYHAAYVHSFQANVISLLASGVFEELPRLQVIMEEGGFAWAVALAWRLDRAWRLMGREATHRDQPPSETLRNNFWFTTQPIDEAEHPEHFREMLGHLEHLGLADRVMFSTDYPHWDFDAPDKSFPEIVTGELRERIFRRNAAALFRFPSGGAR